MSTKPNERYQYFDNNRRASGLLRYCKYCGQPITFKSFESVKILNPNSFFFWKREVTRRWIALDYYTEERHQHKQHNQEVAA